VERLAQRWHMRLAACLACACLVLPLSAADQPAPAPPKSSQTVNGAALEVTGKTQPAPGRKAIIAPVPLHPVVEVLVAPGDRVKKGQVLIKLDADEPEADVRSKQAALDSAVAAVSEARRYLPRVEDLYRSGAISDVAYHQARLGLLTAEANE